MILVSSHLWERGEQNLLLERAKELQGYNRDSSIHGHSAIVRTNTNLVTIQEKRREARHGGEKAEIRGTARKTLAHSLKRRPLRKLRHPVRKMRQTLLKLLYLLLKLRHLRKLRHLQILLHLSVLSQRRDLSALRHLHVLPQPYTKRHWWDNASKLGTETKKQTNRIVQKQFLPNLAAAKNSKEEPAHVLSVSEGDAFLAEVGVKMSTNEETSLLRVKRKWKRSEVISPTKETNVKQSDSTKKATNETLSGFARLTKTM